MGYCASPGSGHVCFTSIGIVFVLSSTDKGHLDTEIINGEAASTRITARTFQHWDEWGTRKTTGICPGS